ncbi:MAG: hypothetical protein JSV36_17305 [Anaerolineae bacterium]|nr:MAG: hypothetical protein JSV36_17305 [Anaerolineae bacterium]
MGAILVQVGIKVKRFVFWMIIGYNWQRIDGNGLNDETDTDSRVTFCFFPQTEPAVHLLERIVALLSRMASSGAAIRLFGPTEQRSVGLAVS